MNQRVKIVFNGYLELDWEERNKLVSSINTLEHSHADEQRATALSIRESTIFEPLENIGACCGR